jgi:hypothetical protein
VYENNRMKPTKNFKKQQGVEVEEEYERVIGGEFVQSPLYACIEITQ